MIELLLSRIILPLVVTDVTSLFNLPIFPPSTLDLFRLITCHDKTPFKSSYHSQRPHRRIPIAIYPAWLGVWPDTFTFAACSLSQTLPILSSAAWNQNIYTWTNNTRHYHTHGAHQGMVTKSHPIICLSTLIRCGKMPRMDSASSHDNTKLKSIIE